MKTLIALLPFLVLGAIGSYFLTWPYLSILGFMFGSFYMWKLGKTFFLFFLCGALIWGVNALYINIQNDGILSGRIGEMLGGLDGIIVVLITCLIGGLLAGTGSLSGAALSQWISKKNKKNAVK